MIFFFFKQKTSYEMRMSDWSSDVCSAELAWRGRCAGRCGAIAARSGAPRRRRTARRSAGLRPAAGAGEERTSVVSGKSGPVRVDLGGRRILKKKKTPQRCMPTMQIHEVVTRQYNRNHSQIILKTIR